MFVYALDRIGPVRFRFGGIASGQDRQTGPHLDREDQWRCPQLVLLQFEFDELKARGAGVLDAARLARILPDEIAVIGGHSSICVPRNDFCEHAAMNIDPQTRRALRDLPGGLAGIERHSPSPRPRVIHDLAVAVHTGAVRNRVSGRAGFLMGSGRLLGAF